LFALPLFLDLNELVNEFRGSTQHMLFGPKLKLRPLI